MATDANPPKIELIDSVADKEQTDEDRQEDSHVDISYNSYNSGEFQDISLKLGSSITQVCLKVKSKFKTNRYCLWSSKAVILILTWNLIIYFGFRSFFDPSFYTVTLVHFNFDDTDYYSASMIFGIPYGISALLLVFYPLAAWIPG